MRVRPSVISPQARVAAANARRMQGAAPPPVPTTTPMPGMKKGGFVRSADGIAKKGKTKATQIKMCGGGMARKGK